MRHQRSLSLALAIFLTALLSARADDDPREAAEYKLLRETGGPAIQTAPNPLGRAINRVQQLRRQVSTAQPAAASPPGIIIFSAKEAGTPTDYGTIAGIPVGEFALAAQPSAAAPVPEAAPRAVEDPRKGMLDLTLEPLVPALPQLGISVPLGPEAPSGISPSRWNWLGPGNIGGRTRSIIIHPTRPATMWLGAVAGGIWKTIDSGRSWAPMADFMGSLNVSTMILDPDNPDLIFAGTGEGYYNLDAFRGAGIFRSGDGGATWQQLPATANDDFNFVNRLAITVDHRTLLVATRSGLYTSTNFRSGDIATVTFAASPTLHGRDILDVSCSGMALMNCVASGRGRSIFFSTDAGASWAMSAGLPNANPSEMFTGRVEVTYAASDPSLVYASIDRNMGEIYRSQDAGRTFALRNTGTRYLSAQGWYDNAIWASDPNRPNLVVVGGIDLYRSLDGGATLTRISDWRVSPASAHADHHTIISHPGYNGTTNRIVFFGNDGGVYRNDDILTGAPQRGWTALNNNYGVTQFYGGAGNVASGHILAGAQDNGTLVYRPPPGSNTGPNGYTAKYGGDGGFVAADPTDPNMMYGEYVYLQIHRSIDGGNRSSPIYTGIDDAGNRDKALFVAPFILDPVNPETMLAGGAALWRSPNVTAGTPAWTSIKEPLARLNNGPPALISAVEARPTAPQLTGSDSIWVGYSDGRLFRSGFQKSQVGSQ
jgi:photosystem II stability/assembly factor-like uncharacterized protein